MGWVRCTRPDSKTREVRDGDDCQRQYRVRLVLFELSVVAVSFQTNPSEVGYTNVVVLGRSIDYPSDTS